jgi:hypothetical protein
MALSPSRGFLAFPAWVWLFPPPLLVLFTYLLGIPTALSEPGERADLFDPIILVARDGESFRFVSWEEQQNVTPLWSLTCRTTATSDIRRCLGWGGETAFGFWKQSGSWRYGLETTRFDKDWKPGSESFSLAADDVKRLRPLVIRELNRRSPNEHRGDRLTQLLDNGIERSSYLCVQNAAILLAWLSVPIALAAIVAMFIEPQQTKAHVG